MKSHVVIICPDCGDCLSSKENSSDDSNYECVLDGSCVNCYTHVIAFIPTKKYVRECDKELREQIMEMARSK
jgi:hypothetical protein